MFGNVERSIESSGCRQARQAAAGLPGQKETGGQESVRRRWGGSTAGYAGDGGINLDL